jgi:hypothetical protein
VSIRTLHLAKNLTLPLDAVTQTFAFFGKRGSGKTNGATVIVEELLRAHLPVVVLDPVDAWWGLKSSFNGKHPGLPIYVFGGPHKDLPLEPTAGALIADVVAKEHLPLILSMKEWGVGERARFVTDFAKRLLQVNQDPVMMVLEEADAFIPQRPAKGEEAMLGAMDRLVRWGRQSGVGCTIVTQRSAKVNKDVTTQAETLVAFRTTGPQDRDAIDSWIKFHAGDEKREEILSTLPTLPNGTAWLWSPEWLGRLDRVAFRRRETYDSAATPKVGETRPKPKQLAAVDLDRLRDQMAETVERAKADDPRELRKQIAELKRELTAKQQTAAPASEAVVQDPALEKRHRETVAKLKKLAHENLERIFKHLHSHAEAQMFRWTVQEQKARDWLQVLRSIAVEAPRQNTHAPHATGRRTPPAASQGRRVAPVAATSRPAPPVSRSNGAIAPAQQRILNGLAFLQGIGVTPAGKTQLALLVGVSPTSGGYFNNLGALRSAGFIEYPTGGTVTLTSAGAAIASTDGVPSTTRELHDAIRGKLPPAKWKIVEALIRVYPKALTKDALAEQLAVSPTSGGYFNNLGSLRSLGLVDYPQPGTVAALPVLFLD